MTIDHHFLEMQSQFPDATGDFTNLMYDIALAAKVIGREVSRAGLVDILGMAGRRNIQGEQVQKLDVFANETMVRMNAMTGRVCVMASEEVNEIIPAHPDGKYVLVFDPLDGSSNIDVNVSIGTIFSVFRRKSSYGPGVLEDCLQPGRDLVAAGYVVYGSSTMLVYSGGQGVHGFTLDPSVGEFLLSHSSIITPKAKYYSINHAYLNRWTPGISALVSWLQGDATDSPKLSERYIGSMVADIHRNLLAGGIFIYPSDEKNPQGKLRLLYEAAPLSFLAEQAGGYSSNGFKSILDIVPQELHQRVPVFIGERPLVERAERFLIELDGDSAI